MRLSGIPISITIITVLAGFFLAVVPAAAQVSEVPANVSLSGNEMVYQPSSESFIWIEGSSNVNEFTCKSDRVRGQARVSPEIGGIQATSVEVIIPVKGLDCGKRQMNRDMYKTLKADDFPDIQFELIDAYIVGDAPVEGNSYLIRVEGELTVAGATRHVAFEALGEMGVNNKYKIRGKKDILMTDFGLEPPTALLGLVKARDELVVHFELLAQI
jgi:polyisoprenoid-binding protein YceI